MELTNWTKIFS